MSKVKASKNKASDVETPQLPTAPRQQPNHRQALQFLDQVCGLAPVNRQTHIQVQQSLQQLSGAIIELEKLKNEKK